MKNVITYYENPSDKEGSCNTPQNIQSLYTVKIDWLTIIAEIKSPVGLNQLIKDVEDIFTDKFVIDAGDVWRGRRWTGGMAKSQYGIELCWDSVSEEDSPQLRLSIPGAACSRADVLDYARFINGLKHYETLGNISCTRLDAAFDDHTKSLFCERDLYEAWQNDSIVRLQNKTHHMHASGAPTGEYGIGWLHRWGRGRKSITFYNKAAESNGKIDSHRIEVRYKEKDANEAFKTLTQLPMGSFKELCISFLSGLVAGVVDFMTFEKGRNHGVRDGKRLGWWQAILDVQEGIDRYSHRPPRSNLKRKLDWFKRQVFTSLAQVSDVVGAEHFDKWVTSCLAEAKKQYRDVHKAFIETSKLEFKRGLYPTE